MDATEDIFDVDCNDEEHYMKFLEEYISFCLDQANNYGISTVIDTIYYMPSDLVSFKYINDIEVYYLSNLDAREDNIREDFKKYSAPYDWPSYASKDDIERNVKFLLDQNNLLIKECQKYNYKLFNTSRGEKRSKNLDMIFNKIVNGKWKMFIKKISKET